MKTSLAETSKGFTLIELLVVIAIIGILSSIVMSSLHTALSKARDSRRLSDLKQIANLVASLGEGVAFVGCTTSGGITDCTTPAIATFVDPSGTSVCSAGASTPPCLYRVSGATVATPPTGTDWQVCASLENPTGDLPAGAIHVGSDTEYTIKAGGCVD